MYLNKDFNAVAEDLLNIKLIIALLFTVDWKTCEAGLRVLGGRDALKDEFPYVVRLEEQGTIRVNGTTQLEYFQFCTGAAITPSWILTAAHCDDDNLSKILDNAHISTKPRIFARYNSYFPNELGHLSPITKMLIYPGYAMSFHFGEGITRSKYDIALFHTENVIVNQYGKISALDYTAFVGHEVFLLGFGGNNGTPMEKPLQVLKGMLLKCEERENPTIGALCIVPPCDVPATVCGGDSGGPVVHASGIVGVVSSSVGNCDEFDRTTLPGHSSGAISMISPAIDWISSIVEN